jgi:glycolate oxidase iron-sulfur subunit
LLAPKIQAVRAIGNRILVTTNTGCALHLAAGAREAGLGLEVLHPVELILRQLDG